MGAYIGRRIHADVVSASKQKAWDPRIYERKPHPERLDQYAIPLQIEYQLAQDLALIAVHDEQATSAVSVTIPTVHWPRSSVLVPAS